jgi:hypothetical protein
VLLQCVEGSLGWPWSFGLATKDEAGPKALRWFFSEEGNPGVCRVDNEPVLRGADSDFVLECAKPKADPHVPGFYRATPIRWGPPYEPVFQSRVERIHGVMECLG